MRKLGLLTAVATMAAAVGATGFDGLTLNTNDWFDASFSGVTVGKSITGTDGITRGAGSWTTTPSTGVATNSTDGIVNYVSVAAEDETLTFTPAAFSVTSGYETVTAQVKLNYGDIPETSMTGAQAAFTVTGDSSAPELKGWAIDWVAVANDSLDVDSQLIDKWFTLYMDFANESSTRKVRYSVQPEGGQVYVLTNASGTAWLTTTYKDTITDISFTGNGNVKAFSGDELTTALSISGVSFEFMADYESAKTVTATVGGTVASGTGFTLNIGGSSIAGTYNSESGTVTFGEVTGLSFGDSVPYTITTTTGDSSASTVAVGGSSNSTWINESASTTETTGSWDPDDVDYVNSVAEINGNTFTPNTAAENAVVTVVSTVCFTDVADEEAAVPSDAYAAVRVGSDGSDGYVFQVYAKATEGGTAAWLDAAGVTPVLETTYTLTSVFDFLHGTCSFKVGETPLTYNSSGEFYLATPSCKMEKIFFSGSSKFTSMTGSYVAADPFTSTATSGTVAINNKWVADNLGDKTVAEARALLAADSTVTTNHNGVAYNYFQCYALGIDPADADDAPLMAAAPDGGTIKLSLAGVSVPEGVTATATLQKKNSSGEWENVSPSQSATFVGSAGGTTEGTGTIAINPVEAAEGANFLRLDISVDATTDTL